MKKLMPLVAIAMLVAMGCQDKSNSTSANNSVTDLASTSTPAAGEATPSYASTPSYQAAPAPMPAYAAEPAPVMATALPAGEEASATPAISTEGGKYTVKHGDTLWKIAASHYGDGKQWHKIADANPGLSPTSLKVGQVITLP